MTIGSKPRTAAKSGNSKTTAAKPVAVHATGSDSDDSDPLALSDSGNGNNDEDSSDRSGNGDSDIAKLSEREARQVLNNEVIFLYSNLTLSTNNKNNILL